MYPTCPNRHCITTPLYIWPQRVPASLCRPISPSHHHLTLPGLRDRPLARYQRRRGENLLTNLRRRRADCHRSRPSLLSLPASMIISQPQLPNPSLILDLGALEHGPRRAPKQVLRPRHVDPRLERRPTSAAPLRARLEALRPLDASPWPEKAPRWATLPPRSALGFPLYFPWPGEEDDHRPSIQTWSDDPGHPIPLRPSPAADWRTPPIGDLNCALLYTSPQIRAGPALC
jgi:hypothetical protein